MFVGHSRRGGVAGAVTPLLASDMTKVCRFCRDRRASKLSAQTGLLTIEASRLARLHGPSSGEVNEGTAASQGLAPAGVAPAPGFTPRDMKLRPLQ